MPGYFPVGRRMSLGLCAGMISGRVTQADPVPIGLLPTLYQLWLSRENGREFPDLVKFSKISEIFFKNLRLWYHNMEQGTAYKRWRFHLDRSSLKISGHFEQVLFLGARSSGVQGNGRENGRCSGIENSSNRMRMQIQSVSSRDFRKIGVGSSIFNRVPFLKKWCYCLVWKYVSVNFAVESIPGWTAESEKLFAPTFSGVFNSKKMVRIGTIWVPWPGWAPYVATCPNPASGVHAFRKYCRFQNSKFLHFRGTIS